MKPILLEHDSQALFVLLSFVLKNLSNYGRRHSKLFIPTVMFRGTPCIYNIYFLNSTLFRFILSQNKIVLHGTTFNRDTKTIFGLSLEDELLSQFNQHYGPMIATLWMFCRQNWSRQHLVKIFFLISPCKEVVNN